MRPAAFIRSLSPEATIPFLRNSPAAAVTIRLRVCAASSFDFLMRRFLEEILDFVDIQIRTPSIWMSLTILVFFKRRIQMLQGKVLVTGATGDTGRATIDELLARGHPVRALAHREDNRSKKLQGRGVEVVFGDLLDFGQVRSALNGVQRAYFVYPIRPGILQATAYFAQAAKEAGVDGIVNMSQKSARQDAKSHAATDHWLSERVFDWSGVPVAHIRPTYFAEWLLYLAPMIKAGRLHVPFGTGKHAPIAAEDQGRVIAGILEDPAPHKGGDLPALRPGRIHLRGDRPAPEPGPRQGRPIQTGRLRGVPANPEVRRPEAGIRGIRHELVRGVGAEAGFRRFLLHPAHQRGRDRPPERHLRGHQRPRREARRPSPDDARGVHHQASQGFRVIEGANRPIPKPTSCIMIGSFSTALLAGTMAGVIALLAFRSRRGGLEGGTAPEPCRLRRGRADRVARCGDRACPKRYPLWPPALLAPVGTFLHIVPIRQSLTRGHSSQRRES